MYIQLTTTVIPQPCLPPIKAPTSAPTSPSPVPPFRIEPNRIVRARRARTHPPRVSRFSDDVAPAQREGRASAQPLQGLRRCGRRPAPARGPDAGDPEEQPRCEPPEEAPRRVPCLRRLRYRWRDADWPLLGPPAEGIGSSSLDLVCLSWLRWGILDLTVLDLCSRAARGSAGDGAGRALGRRRRAAGGYHPVPEAALHR